MLLCTALISTAQEVKPVQFKYDQTRKDDTVILSIKALINPDIKLYSIHKTSDDAPFTTITFDSTATKYVKDSVDEKGKLQTATDTTFHTQVKYYNDSVVWLQKVTAKPSDSLVLKGAISYMYKNGDEYVPAEEPFKFYIQPQQNNTVVSAPVEATNIRHSLWLIFFSAFGSGLVALFTPCIFSMIPVTVSFFTKRSKTRAEGIKNAFIYSLSIIVIFTLVGFLVSLIFGPAALNNLATNWIANLVFFALFFVFGISFLGAFEITLPASWSTQADTKAGMHNVAGIFFMALTLVIVSFSCTGPVIGPLLVLAFNGSFYGPLIGMLGFSIALALPFALFALFPGMLNVLGRSGGWLNAVKVTLGFIELALALKFLSNADLSKGWRLLDREVFLSLWIVIFALLGLYLLGKIKLHHDTELPVNESGLPYLSIPRLLFAITVFTFVVYMVPGLWGAPLKAISAFVPPMGTQDFNASVANNANAVNYSSVPNSNAPHPVKYVDKMKIYEPEVVTKYGMHVYYDYKEALAASVAVHKPLMLDFTGINCVNCRKMEGQVWSNPEVMRRLKEDFIIVSLYVDVQNIDLPQSEQYFSKALNKQVETLGDLNTDRQVTYFKANTQPFYFFLDGDEKRLVEDGYGYDASVEKFIQLLDNVKAKYQQSSM
ncbi:protein-disulfide reductase [Ilyomonas limi]|uniref:Protein-disulfide reductase n=2 Tax=Ilyomonas limi TaxID=2575867 RepID=A0A4U3L433_9BACT|nr:protein-disulfide reductase [Ilyomonas limi]